MTKLSVSRRLFAFVDELADEIGPVDEAEVAKYSELFASTAAVTLGTNVKVQPLS